MTTEHDYSKAVHVYEGFTPDGESLGMRQAWCLMEAREEFQKLVGQHTFVGVILQEDLPNVAYVFLEDCFMDCEITEITSSWWQKEAVSFIFSRMKTYHEARLHALQKC